MGIGLAVRPARRTRALVVTQSPTPTPARADRTRASESDVSERSQPRVSQADHGSPPRDNQTGAADLDGDISQFLQKWTAAIRERNIAAQVELYAPYIQRFYGRRGLTKTQLQREREHVFGRLGEVRQFDVTNIHVSPNSDSAAVTYDKTWSFAGSNPFAGSAKNEMLLRRIGGEWKIVSERELQVYWVKHGPASNE